jgi:hypothetical protein
MPHVSIESQGRCGTLTYHEAAHTLACYWEFGGGDAVAVVQCGSAADWARHPWALERRSEILQYIADEMVRQQAPSCRAEIDQVTGDIVLRQDMHQEVRRKGRTLTPASLHKPAAASSVVGGGVPPATRTAEARWFFRLTSLRMYLGLAVLAGALLVGVGLWIKDAVFSIDPGKGTAIGYSVRTDRHIATLIQTLEPYVPSLDRNHGNDRYGISLYLVPLDGSTTRLVPLRRGLAPDAFPLARVFGSDGRTLWFNVAGLGGVELDGYTLRTDAEAAAVDPRSLPRPWGDLPLAPAPEQFLAAGLMTSPTTWLGLHSAAEAERSFGPQQWLRPVVRAENTRGPRRFYLGEIEPEPVTGYSRILHMRALAAAEYLDAALLRTSNTATPIRLDDPPGAMMLYTSMPGPLGTAVVARVDDTGNLQWRVDTGIARFGLQQILPGDDVTAFVGTRPPVPDKVPEPLLVIVDHSSGKQATYSLWQ